MLEGPKQWIQLDEGSNSAIGYPPWNGGAGLLLLGLEVERRAGVLTYILHLFAFPTDLFCPPCASPAAATTTAANHLSFRDFACSVHSFEYL